MWPPNYLIFCGLALLTTLSPGPALLLTLSNTLAVGPRRAMLGALGNALGLLLVSSLVMAGLGLLLIGSAKAFGLLKLTGAAYLIYLGVQQWRASSQPAAQTGPGLAPKQGTLALFSRGVAVALTNPKAILFFSALFPQFISADRSVLGQFVVLTLTFAASALFSHAVYASIAAALRSRLGSTGSRRQQQSTRLFKRGSAVAFVGLGLSLLRLPGPVA